MLKKTLYLFVIWGGVGFSLPVFFVFYFFWLTHYHYYYPLFTRCGKSLFKRNVSIITETGPSKKKIFLPFFFLNKKFPGM